MRISSREPKSCRCKTRCSRRVCTITPSIVQGLVSCSKSGYAMSHTSTRSSARNIHYYRCLGSEAWRRLSGQVCDNPAVRQNLLDRVVWAEVVRLLEDPTLSKAHWPPATSVRRLHNVMDRGATTNCNDYRLARLAQPRRYVPLMIAGKSPRLRPTSRSSRSSN
jgi:hypothetical protein